MNRFLKKDFRVMLVGLLLLASCQAYSDSEDKIDRNGRFI